MMMHFLFVYDRPEKEPPLFFAANERFEERLFPNMMPTQKKAHLAPKRSCVSFFTKRK